MPAKKHPPNNELCPTCGGPCLKITRTMKSSTGKSTIEATGYDSLHDTLVQQAVDEVVKNIYNEAMKYDYTLNKLNFLTWLKSRYPNAIPKDGE